MKREIRLSVDSIAILKILFKNYFLDSDSLWIFGSRVDPNKN